MLDPTKKDTPCPRAKEKPGQDGRRGKTAFKIKPHAHQRLSEGSHKRLCAPGDPTETEPDLPVNEWAGKDWRQEEKGTTEDEMVGWHHWFDGHEFEWAPEVGDGQGILACCSPRSCKESDTIEWLNWTELACISFITVVWGSLAEECLELVCLGLKLSCITY